MSDHQVKALPTQRIGPEAFEASPETALWWLSNAGFGAGFASGQLMCSHWTSWIFRAAPTR